MNLINYYNFGYNKLGPLLYGFSYWLLDNFQMKGIKKVFFLSRDGLIMKNAFDVINSKSIDTYYLEVSRRSLRVPILWQDCSFNNLMTMLAPSKLITLTSIFDAVGLNIDEYNDRLREYGLNHNSYFYRKDIKTNNKLLALYSELEKDIIDCSRKEQELLIEYLKENKVEGKFAIVDIGWSGGMQRFLQMTLNNIGIENEIYGYYTGIANYYNRNTINDELNINGYLFDFSKNPLDVDVRSSFVGLYELMFLETKGSVKNYKRDSSGKIIAIRYPYEYIKDDKELPEIQCLRCLQKGAIDFVLKMKNNNIIINKEELSRSLIIAGSKPTKETLSLFGDFSFFDEGEYCKLARPNNLLYYCFHPKQLRKDFYKSRWKTGFLKKLLVLPLNYQIIYDFFKKVNTL